MTKWPWLIIILALISTVQWPNSIAQHNYDNNAYQKGYLWYSKKYHRSKRSVFNERNIISTTTSSYAENRKIEDRTKVNNTNIRSSPISSITKFSLRNDFSSNNSYIPTKSVSTIVFPNSGDGKISKINFVPDQHLIEKCSMNGSYCVKVDNYPRQELLHIFRSSKFRSTHPISIDDDTENEITDAQTRLANNYYKPICDSTEETIFPEAGLTKNNEWLYIVQDSHNVSSGFRQGIKVELCSKNDMSNELVSNCKFNDYLPQGYTSVCVQKYIYKKLMTIDKSKEIYYEKFLFPSCCTCMYNETDTKSRRGGVEEHRRFS